MRKIVLFLMFCLALSLLSAQRNDIHGFYILEKENPNPENSATLELELKSDSTYYYFCSENNGKPELKDFGKWFSTKEKVVLNSADTAKGKRFFDLELFVLCEGVLYIPTSSRGDFKRIKGTNRLVMQGHKAVFPLPVKDYEMPDNQYETFKTIHDYWYRNIYWNCLDTFQLKMECSECEYIYMDILLFIDQDGRLEKYLKLSVNICGENISNDLMNCFIEYFEKYEFPECLKGRIIETRLGTGLKC